MYLHRKIITILLLLCTAACAPLVSMSLHSINKPAMQESFDASEVAFLWQTGTGVIEGRVLLTLDEFKDGEYSTREVLGKFSVVRLIPYSDYAREHLWNLFQGEKLYLKASQPLDLDPAYERAMRYQTSDILGNFAFHGVAAGNYFLYATSARTNPPFALADAIVIKDNQRAAITLHGHLDDPRR